VPPSRPGVAPPRAASAGAAAIPYPAERVPLRLPVPAVPPFVQTPQRRYGELVALKWAGVLLILLAALTAFALIVRDIRSDPKSIPQPTAQLVIPAANGPSAGDAAAAIVPNPAFQGNVICLDAAHGGIDRGFRRTGDATAPAMDEALYTAAYARELAGQLTAMGFTVVLTRDGDTVRNTEFQDVNRDGQTRESGATEADAEHNALLD
jgi:N-acetylmuramoyl-L-alanine amidase